ncbi:hypothetical protein GCM10007933_33890 [Zoogloea oryzae]|uniref:DUF1840 domain-containing protein n=2 Tax=Zoogloea oryzae TaxID=310767 RepID=A0ABQ6FE83_9RHOO|nr:hypothetical protein GCM10007933_33890 [Zoogloea oryzae]
MSVRQRTQLAWRSLGSVAHRPAGLSCAHWAATLERTPIMLITFKSAASGDLITFEKNARQMLEVLGKDRDDGQGIFTVEQLPAAIDCLRRAIADDVATYTVKAGAAPQSMADEGEGVSFHQRAVPLLDMLERAAADGVPVTWGV